MTRRMLVTVVYQEYRETAQTLSASGHKGNYISVVLFLLLAYVGTAQSLHCSQKVLVYPHKTWL